MSVFALRMTDIAISLSPPLSEKGMQGLLAVTAQRARQPHGLARGGSGAC